MERGVGVEEVDAWVYMYVVKGNGGCLHRKVE